MKNLKSEKNQKSSFFNFLIFRGKNVWFFFGHFFRKSFFGSEKKYFFSELDFFFGYSFDVKIHDLSIYEVFRAIPELLRGLIDRRVAGCRKKSVKILKITGSSCRVIGGPGWKIISRWSSGLAFGSIKKISALGILRYLGIWCSRSI